jgi:DNA-binding GntR family transcriptional regulator
MTFDAVSRRRDNTLRCVGQCPKTLPGLVGEHETQVSHRAILDAVIAKDRRLAKRMTKAHITSAGEVMLEALRMQRP